jgi:Asp-tRNA(Asn)/Glu-tRNA(Gln) amidotransferase A subunit family amidase
LTAPIAIDSASLAVVYQIIAQVGATHHYSRLYGGVGPPPPHLAGFNQVASLEHSRLGVFTAHFEDASGSMVAGCYQAVEVFKSLVATIVEVNISHMTVLALTHGLTIGFGMISPHEVDWWQHRKHVMPDSETS